MVLLEDKKLILQCRNSNETICDSLDFMTQGKRGREHIFRVLFLLLTNGALQIIKLRSYENYFDLVFLINS